MTDKTEISDDLDIRDNETDNPGMSETEKYGLTVVPPVSDLPQRVIMDLAITCNLRCPMCPVWGSDDKGAIDSVRGTMDLDHANALLDELESEGPLVHPALYGEPFLAPHFEEVVKNAKSKGMPVAINTNGLALSDRLVQFINDEKIDSIMFSIDAVTKETLKLVRGVDKLDKIKDAVSRMMKSRGQGEFPRIGVSFTRQEENKHELDEFIAYWTKIVDVVRVGNIFKDGFFQNIPISKDRKPCPVLYKTMPVHNDGTVTICCLDSFRETNVGNVFEDGVRGVWQGEKFQEVRRLHEEGRWDEVPICKDCNGWAQYEYAEEVTDELLIRRSPEFTYYNRLERLKNWSGRLMGGHTTEETHT